MARLLSLFLSLSLMLVGTALADDKVPTFDAQSPKSVALAMQDLGYKAELDQNDNGEPIIQGRIARANYTMIFQGCTHKKDCLHILFLAWWDVDTKTDHLPAVNDWNRDHVMGRAFLNKDEDSIGFDFALATVGGMTRDTFADNLQWWGDILGDFYQFLDENVYGGPPPDTADDNSRDI
ncbi:YbjN domain-containing protein [Oryzibacter oryziterrae]|uniref:YbjN domain-containing protein n=1 Tax=Oryzibacter oryziterrae TaxID=2766474 RepID=UPI001F410DCC|nr:YbjN domain-containing protein [Oryzibacter oryziterrae]